MAKITNIIPKQSFEIVRDQIALLLADEIINQVMLSGNYELDATVYVERHVPPNTSELDKGPLVNVLVASGSYDNEDITMARGTVTYFIDVYTLAKTKADTPGDTRAMIKLQRMTGVCRSILQDAKYVTLGFEAPFIMGREVKSFQIAQPDPSSADDVVRGRLILEVKMPEDCELITAKLIDGSDTTVFLDITDEGYIWVNDNYQ